MIFFQVCSTKYSKLIKKERSIAHFLPYRLHLNKNTILLGKNILLKVIKIAGISFETMDDEDLDIKKEIRNQLFRGIAAEKLEIYTHIIRRQVSHTQEQLQNHKIRNYFVNFVNNTLNNHENINKNYVNDLYISILLRPQKNPISNIKNIIKNFNKKSNQDTWIKNIHEENEYLEEICNRMMQSLSEYDPEILQVIDTNYGLQCEILSFLNSIINGGIRQNILVSKKYIKDYLANNRISFDFRHLEIDDIKEKKYAGILSIKEYGQNTYAGILDHFLQSPFPLVISQSFKFINRQGAIMKMQLQQNRMIQSEDKAVSQIVEINKALDDATSGKIAFGLHHLSVCCYSDNLKQLENIMANAESNLANCGVYPVREKVNMEAVFWGQLPGNTEYVARAATISTANFAGFNSLHNFPQGKKHNNHWGDALTILNTSSGTPFYFNFHIRDVGHTMIIGPTGSGKTVLLNFLCTQAIKYNPRMFFFDKDHGGEIFIRALGGYYTTLEANHRTGFNPLQMDDTNENRTFLTEWLHQLVTAYVSELSTVDIAHINDAVNGNFKLKKEDRNLTNLIAFMGIDSPETVAGRISMWHGSGSHAALFDNREDALDLTKNDIFGFEMGPLLQDKISLGPVLSYLFHRISISLDGRPTMIILDEAWALIDNPIFAPKIKDWLKVLRKLNTFVIFATQSVEDASKSQISDTLIQQTATQIFLPNLKATKAYREIFMLSQREFALIKNTDPSTRYFLIKQELKSVVAKLDLQGMDEIINVLSGRAETVLLLNKIREEVDDNPRIWLSEFNKALREMNQVSSTDND